MATTPVKFIKGVVNASDLPKRSLPTVAFFGRSNVGKSSVINSLFRNKNLARSSSKPGRTTEINYYLVDDRSYLADLPGYGYAELPNIMRLKIAHMLAWYAAAKEVDLRFAVLIVDGAIGAQDSDQETFALLRKYGKNIIIVANKVDKGHRNNVSNHLRAMKETFPDCPIIRYSAKTGEGREGLFDRLWPQHFGCTDTKKKT